MIRTIRGLFAPFAPAPRRRRPNRPALEALEGRQLLSYAWPPDRVNTTVEHLQSTEQGASDTASSGGGMKVVVWQDVYSSTDVDIRAQRYDAQGNKLGSEIGVDTSAAYDWQPRVAMDDQGNFVVAWTRGLGNGDPQVMVQRYSASGASLGSAFSVNPYRPYMQYGDTFAPDVAMDAHGNFAVVYQFEYSPTDYDIYAKLYNSQGASAGTVYVATSGQHEYQPSIAMTPGGAFAVAYTRQSDIYLARYQAGGAVVGTTVVANSASIEDTPSVAINYWGEAVVAYEVSPPGDYSLSDIMARRVDPYNNVGLPVGIATSAAGEFNPSVAMYRWGSEFVVAFDDYNGAWSDSLYVRAVAVSAHNTLLWTRGSATLHNALARPSIGLDATGNFLMSFTGQYGWSGAKGRDIWAVRGTLFT